MSTLQRWKENSPMKIKISSVNLQLITRVYFNVRNLFIHAHALIYIKSSILIV